MQEIHQDAKQMIRDIIAENMPQHAVEVALQSHAFDKNIYLLAIGKAAWTMAKAASDFLGERLQKGIVITKYDHSQGPLPRIEIIEAGHPISDANTLAGTEKAMALAQSLGPCDELIFLVSGGGSALFEKPQPGVTLEDLVDINSQLLASGADIVEINQVRKRLSCVKAGRFAQLCSPAQVFTIVLSDVLGDRLDSIASGPAAPDSTTCADVQKVVDKYNLKLTDTCRALLAVETPKVVDNVHTVVTGSVRTLCTAAAKSSRQLGYTPYVLTTLLNCEAREAGRMLASIGAEIADGISCFQRPCAVILGGETVVHMQGKGRGGRNQELALAAAPGIAGLADMVIFSLGSDGTDGPTEAAGGLVDGDTLQKLRQKGLNLDALLRDNDSYRGLQAADGLIVTGPTGTNVNDVSILLCQ